MSGLPPGIRRTVPTTEMAFVDPKTGRLTIWALNYLQRLSQAQNGVIDNQGTIIDMISFPLGGQPSALPEQGGTPADAERFAVGRGLPSDVLVLHDGARVMDGIGDPSGAVNGYVGDLFLRRDGGVGTALYVKQTGTDTASGWAPVVAQGAGGLMPLVNAETPGPGIISDPLGQTIGVPV